MVEYPSQFPIAEGLALVNTIKSGTVKEKKAEFAHSLWVVQGFVQKTVLGDPVAALSAAPKLSEAEIVDVIEKLSTPTDVAIQVAIPWKEILMWAMAELVKVIND